MIIIDPFLLKQSILFYSVLDYNALLFPVLNISIQPTCRFNNWNSRVLWTDQCIIKDFTFSDNANNRPGFLSQLPMSARNIYHHFIGHHIIIWIQNLFFTRSLIRLLVLDYGGFADAKSLFTYNYENSASQLLALFTFSLHALNSGHILVIFSLV